MTRTIQTTRLTNLDLMMLSAYGQSYSQKMSAFEKAAMRKPPGRLQLWLAAQLRKLAARLDPGAIAPLPALS